MVRKNYTLEKKIRGIMTSGLSEINVDDLSKEFKGIWGRKEIFIYAGLLLLDEKYPEKGRFTRKELMNILSGQDFFFRKDNRGYTNVNQSLTSLVKKGFVNMKKKTAFTDDGVKTWCEYTPLLKILY